MEKKFLDAIGVKYLWDKICKRYDKKLDSVTNYDNTVEIHSDREIAVRVSSHKGNLLKSDADGLQVDPLHKLTIGPYEYDGSKDVSVAIYDGEYEDI